MIRQFLSYFKISSVDPEVMRSQVAAFTKRAPLLYIILNANVWSLAHTHYGLAPNFLTLYAPSLLLVICLVRCAIWLRTRAVHLSEKEVADRLRLTYFITGALGIAFTGYALILYPYGDTLAKSHVAFFLSITVIGCIFCLMHLRPAALLLTAIVVIPFTIRFMTTGEPIFTAIALNFCLVAVILIFILFTYHRDFTQLIQSQRHLANLSEQNFKIANLDSLTDLPNRRSFFRDVETLLADRNSDDTAFAFGIVDLDGFKPVNDVYGHAAGDRVLIEVGRRLRSALDAPAVVARLGGDEFGILIPLSSPDNDITEKAAAICEAVQRPIALVNGTARVAASIGFTLAMKNSSTLETLIERADYALYFAKAKHRGSAVIFSVRHETAIRKQSRIEQELRLANLAVEIDLHFQPIVDVARGKVIAREALARWKSPILGDVPPVDFIPAAERMGLINRLTEILFGKALAHLATWPAEIGLSFNLSASDIASPELIATLLQKIEASGVAASRIMFEITETAVLHDFAQARETLQGLKASGAKIALDDFGTGFSSLHYVHRLPLDEIKVDRSFVTDIATDRTSRDIVRSIVSLCRSLKIVCIVEGVETAAQIETLRALRCKTMQGYFFGRPVPAAQINAEPDGIPPEVKSLAA